MECSEIRHVKKARKRHQCDWCLEFIAIGTPYSTWFTYGENVTARLHPECLAAMRKADLYDDELPTPGTYRRGCHCGENIEHCNCDSAAGHESGKRDQGGDS